MLYLVAVLVAAAVAVTLWKLLGPADPGSGRQPYRTVIAPDDDPDFLRELDERARRDEEES